MTIAPAIRPTTTRPSSHSELLRESRARGLRAWCARNEVGAEPCLAALDACGEVEQPRDAHFGRLQDVSMLVVEGPEIVPAGHVEELHAMRVDRPAEFGRAFLDDRAPRVELRAKLRYRRVRVDVTGV